MKLFLIDGHALIFKMYYAFLGRPMINGKGVDTSILFGFTKYLLELIDREQPTHLAVAFDPPGGTFRNEMFPEYKANRTETPQLVIDALEPLTAICRAMDIPVLMVKGFEADDVIGSMAKRAAAEGMDVYMVTPDKDYGQLVGDHIFQYRPGKSGSDNEILAPSDVCAKWGISSTEQVVDILAICGDAADNVPGVKGVGPVGAAKLLAQFGTVDGIYQNLDKLTPRQKALFEEAADHIGLSRELVTIKTDIELGTTMQDMEFTASFTPEVDALFNLYEFRSLKKHLSGRAPAAAGTPVSKVPGTAPLAACFETVDLPALAKAASAAGSCAILEEDGRVALAAQDAEKVLVCVAPASGCAGILRDKDMTKYGFSLKKQMNDLAEEGISLEGRLYDIELMHYILNPERSHALETLASGYLGMDLEESGSKGPDAGLLFSDSEEGPDREEMLTRRVAAILALAPIIRKETEEAGMDGLYDKIEEPLIGVLSRMETTGVYIDVSSLGDFADSLRKTMFEKEAEVRSLAGSPNLNILSPKQLGEVLFEKMKLDPKAKKPARGSWPTDEETLLTLADKSPIIDAILDYRGTRKLLSTYIEPLPGYISGADGRVHTTFNQALTSTGRLSSSNPNLQNIPVRTEQGREIRKAFAAQKPGWLMLSADYSQIELRIMAHLSCDHHLIEAFRSGVDVHAATASKIFNVPVDGVTADQRRVAKTANFGIMYGISAFGLSQRLRCSRSEAKQIIDDYFLSFPSIKSFIADTLSAARETGYVETIFGRRRYLPDLNAHNGNLRALAERNAVNAPIQGSSADIIKLAMTGVDKALRDRRLASRLVLQIHDELMLEVPEEEIVEVTQIVTHEMENVATLSVPLTVECNHGKTWLEAH